MLPLAAGRNVGGHYFWYINLFSYLGPSGVRALPLASGINVGGHYFWYINLFLVILSYLILFTPPLLKSHKGLS